MMLVHTVPLLLALADPAATARGVDFTVPVPSGYVSRPPPPQFADGVVLANETGNTIQVVRGPSLPGVLTVERCASFGPKAPTMKTDLITGGEGGCTYALSGPKGEFFESLKNRGAIAFAVMCSGKSDILEACRRVIDGLKVEQLTTISVLGREVRVPAGWQVSPTMAGQEKLGSKASAEDHAMPVLTLLAPQLQKDGLRARITVAPPSPLLMRTGVCAKAPGCSPEVSCAHDGNAEGRAACDHVAKSFTK